MIELNPSRIVSIAWVDKLFVACRFGTAALVVLMAAQSSAAWLTHTETRTGGDIIIPRFDIERARLMSVSLQVTMLPATTSLGGGHGHPATSILSNNSIGTNGMTPLSTFTVISSTNMGHAHEFSTPDYSASGIQLGTFNGTTALSEPHSHSVRYGFQELDRVGISLSWRVRVSVTPLPVAHTTHTFSGQSKSFVFDDGDTTPFEGYSDLVIPAGEFLVEPFDRHAHSVAPISIPMSTSLGMRSFAFRGVSLLQAEPHTHAIDPSFNVTATFSYIAVPEPATKTNIVVGLILAGLCCRTSLTARRSLAAKNRC
jgi:hypothetical protein